MQSSNGIHETSTHFGSKNPLGSSYAVTTRQVGRFRVTTKAQRSFFYELALKRLDRIAQDYVQSLACDEITKYVPGSPRVCHIPKAMEYVDGEWRRVDPWTEMVFKEGDEVFVLHGTKQVKKEELDWQIFYPFVEGWPYSWRPVLIEHQNQNWAVALKRYEGASDVAVQKVAKALEGGEGVEVDDKGYTIPKKWELERIPQKNGTFEDTFFVRGTRGLLPANLETRLGKEVENSIKPWRYEILYAQNSNLRLRFSLPASNP